MLGVLQDILCVLQNILLAIAFAGVFVVNLIITGAAAFIQFCIDLLPVMPDPPEATNVTALRWMAWFFPVPGAVAVLATFGALLLLYRFAKVALRWLKADS